MTPMKPIIFTVGFRPTNPMRKFIELLSLVYENNYKLLVRIPTLKNFHKIQQKTEWTANTISTEKVKSAEQSCKFSQEK